MTLTPGVRYYLMNNGSAYQVVPVPETQAKRLESSGERVYASSAQAYAVALHLNSRKLLKG